MVGLATVAVNPTNVTEDQDHPTALSSSEGPVYTKVVIMVQLAVLNK